LPVERRNDDMISKLTEKLEKLFQVESDYDEIILKIKSFFELIR